MLNSNSILALSPNDRTKKENKADDVTDQIINADIERFFYSKVGFKKQEISEFMSKFGSKTMSEVIAKSVRKIMDTPKEYYPSEFYIRARKEKIIGMPTSSKIDDVSVVVGLVIDGDYNAQINVLNEQKKLIKNDIRYYGSLLDSIKAFIENM